MKTVIELLNLQVIERQYHQDDSDALAALNSLTQKSLLFQDTKEEVMNVSRSHNLYLQSQDNLHQRFADFYFKSSLI